MVKTMKADPQLSLTDTLKRLGLTHHRGHNMLNTYKHIIEDRDEKVLFVGTADETWKWLRETGRLT